MWAAVGLPPALCERSAAALALHLSFAPFPATASDPRPCMDAHHPNRSRTPGRVRLGTVWACSCFCAAVLVLGLADPRWRRRSATSRLPSGYRRWAAVAVIAHLVLPCAQAQTPITNANIGTAVAVWVTSPGTAATKYGNIVDWNTAAVTSMDDLFYDKRTFNSDIGKWNVASVLSMHSMLNSASAFNRDIGSWNVASVRRVWYSTFEGAAVFNVNLAGRACNHVS